MKKIIALILAVLLLGTVTAFADSALVIADPVVEMESAGETVSLDLAGLKLVFGAVEGDAPGFVLNVYGQENRLLVAAAQLEEGRVLFGAEGLGNTYYIAMPENSPLAGGSLQFNVDTAALEEIMAEAEIDFQGDAITFRLPYTAVTKLLNELRPMFESVPNGEEILSALDEMESTDSGVELSGSVTLGEPVSGKLVATLVDKGVVAEDPFFEISFELSMMDDGAAFSAVISAQDNGALAPVLGLDGSFHTMEGGMTADLTVSLYEDGNAAPVALITLVADSEGLYFNAQIVGAAVLDLRYTSADSLLKLQVEAEGFQGSLMARVTVEEAELVGCALDGANAIDVQNMSDEQSEALMGELQSLVMPVVGFLLPALMSSGVMG